MESIYFFPFSFHDRRLLGSQKIFQSSSLKISPSMQSQPVGSMEVPYTPKTSFPLTLAIVVAALLCTLLCLLVRYRHCCRRSRVVLEPSLHPAVGGNISMTKIDIEALPTTVYHTGLPFSDMDCAICLSESTGMVCPICLSEFVEGEKLRVLPGCCHSFHVDCVDGWLISNSTCPSCRQSLLDVRLKKSIGVTDPAVEAAQSAQIQVNERNEGVTVTHTVQSFLG